MFKLRNWHNFLYDTNELAGGAGTTADEVLPVVDATSVDHPPLSSPWAADASAYFGDNADAVAGFDRYMREKQQPYVTQLEESTADARELWNDIQNDTDTTLRTLIGQRYGDDLAAEFYKQFDEPATEPDPVDDIPEWAKPLVESHQQKVDRELAETQAASYSTFKDGLKTSHDLTDDDIELIDPFIYGSPSDPDAAVASYKAWRAKALGETPAPAAEVQPTPPVLGSDGVATPPLATQYTTYDQVGDAFAAFRARQAAASNPPPVVG